MICKRSIWFRFAICAPLLAFGTAKADERSSLASDVKSVLAWLPLETESVFVSDGRIRLPVESDQKGLDPTIPRGVHEALHDIRAGKFESFFAKQSVTVAVRSACRFKGSDSQRGFAKYAGCQLVVFERDLGSAAVSALAAMSMSADESFVVQGKKVLLFKERISNQEWTLFVAIPTDRVLCVATEEKYLRDLMARIEKRPTDSFLENKRIGSALPLDAPLWAVGEYKQRRDIEAPRGAIGFTVALYDGKNPDELIGIVKYWTEGHVSLNSMRELWRLWNTDPPKYPSVEEKEPGIYELRFLLSKDRDLSSILLTTRWRLGHVFSD